MIRRAHLFIGCFFAPLLIYFCVSGAWQTFDLHHHPKGVDPTTFQKTLHALSMPHTDDTMPGGDSANSSTAFKYVATLMAFGFVATALLGVKLALQQKKMRTQVVLTLILGIVIPVLLLFLKG